MPKRESVGAPNQSGVWARGGALHETWARGKRKATSPMHSSKFTSDRPSKVRSHNTRMQRTIHRIGAVALAGILVLAGCAPAGRDQACDAVRIFSRSVGSANINYVELATLTSRLSDDLYAAAQQANNQVLRSDIRYAAGAARDVTTVIRNRQSRTVIEIQIDIFVDALNDLRFSHC